MFNLYHSQIVSLEKYCLSNQEICLTEKNVPTSRAFDVFPACFATASKIFSLCYCMV